MGKGKKKSKNHNQQSKTERTGEGSSDITDAKRAEDKNSQESQVEEQFDIKVPATCLDSTEHITQTTSSLELTAKESFPPLTKKDSNVKQKQPSKEPISTKFTTAVASSTMLSNDNMSKLNVHAKEFKPPNDPSQSVTKRMSQDDDSRPPKSSLNRGVDQMEMSNKNDSKLAKTQFSRDHREHDKSWCNKTGRERRKLQDSRDEQHLNKLTYQSREYSSRCDNSQNNSSHRGSHNLQGARTTGGHYNTVVKRNDRQNASMWHSKSSDRCDPPQAALNRTREDTDERHLNKPTYQSREYSSRGDNSQNNSSRRGNNSSHSQQLTRNRNDRKPSDSTQEHTRHNYQNKSHYDEDKFSGSHNLQGARTTGGHYNTVVKRNDRQNASMWHSKSSDRCDPPQAALNRTWDDTSFEEGIPAKAENDADWNISDEENAVPTSTSSYQSVSELDISSSIVDDRDDGTLLNESENNLSNLNKRQYSRQTSSDSYSLNDRRSGHLNNSTKGRNQEPNRSSHWGRNSDVGTSMNYNQRVNKRNSDHYNKTFVGEDEDFTDFFRSYDEYSKFDHGMVKEIEKDLFEMSKEYSLAHCVAMDMRMGSGIAVTFKREFKKLDELLAQRQKQGGLALLDVSQDANTKRFIYYLVTKRESSGKPSYETFWSSLKKMRDHIKTNAVKKLAIPRLGCGLDRLEWHTVKAMLEYLFKGVDVEIIVCNFQQTDEGKSPAKSSVCRVVEVPTALKDIEESTIIIYFSTETGDESPVMKQLSEKFPFMQHFTRTKKILGDVIRFENKQGPYILYGCIVRKTVADPFCFISFGKCLLQINKFNKKDQYYYVATQVTHDAQDSLLHKKIVTLMINWLRNVDVYVCLNNEAITRRTL